MYPARLCSGTSSTQPLITGYSLITTHTHPSPHTFTYPAASACTHMHSSHLQTCSCTHCVSLSILGACYPHFTHLNQHLLRFCLFEMLLDLPKVCGCEDSYSQDGCCGFYFSFACFRPLGFTYVCAPMRTHPLVRSFQIPISTKLGHNIYCVNEFLFLNNYHGVTGI